VLTSAPNCTALFEMFSFIRWPLYSQGKSCRSDGWAPETAWTMLAFKSRFPICPTCSMVITLIERPRLQSAKTPRGHKRP
jgi:hypothetical protein